MSAHWFKDLQSRVELETGSIEGEESVVRNIRARTYVEAADVLFFGAIVRDCLVEREDCPLSTKLFTSPCMSRCVSR